MQHAERDGPAVTVEFVVVGTLAAVLLGMSKTGMPSIGALGVAVLAVVMPPVESSGVVLPTLLVGDVVALWLYGRSADRSVLRRLVPGVVVGVLLGYLTLRIVDESTGGRLIGVLLVAAGLGELVRRLLASRAAVPAVALVGPGDVGQGSAAPPAPRGGAGHRAVQHLLGAGAGLSTMVANAGGPMMTVYLLRAELATVALMGTSTWFFFAINVVKVPFSVGLGLISADSLPVSLALVPGLLVGALLGRLFAVRAPRAVFDAVALWGTAAAGVWLLVR